MKFSYPKAVSIAALLIVVALLLYASNKMFVIVDNTPLTLQNFERVFSSVYIWNDFLSTPSVAQAIFNYNTYFLQLGKLLDFNVAQILILVKGTFMLLAYYGMYLWLTFLNEQFFKRSLTTHAITLGSLLYVINPTFFIGEHFWVSIQVGYYSVPLIGYFTFRFFQSGKFWYICFLSLLLSVNTAGHFVYGGFVLVILLSWWLAFSMEDFSTSLISRQFFRLSLVGLFYFLALAPQIIGTALVVSDVSTYLTKEAIDSPWSTAYIFNTMRGMSLTGIVNDFFGYKGTLYSAVVIVFTFVPILLVSLGLFIRRNCVRQIIEKKIWIFYSTLVSVLLLIIGIFSISGPLKELHYFLTINFPLGKVLRTWRVPETIAWLSISLTLPVALYYLTKPIKAHARGMLYIVATLSIVSLISPVLFGHINGELIVEPDQYKKIFANSTYTKNERVMFSPEMIASYGTSAALRPQWSKVGMVMEFLGYSTPMSAIIPADIMRHFYFYTVSEFYGKTGNLIQNKDYFVLARLLGFLNVKYLVLRSDSDTSLVANGIIDDIQQSSSWKYAGAMDGLTLLENQYKGAPVSVFQRGHVLFVDGGYRAVKKFLKRNEDNIENFLLLFTDQDTKATYQNKEGVFITDKVKPTIDENLLIDKLKDKNLNNQGVILFPSAVVRRHDPDNVWSTANLLDIHQTEWHPYANHMSEYAWDFEFNKGLVFVTAGTDSIKLPVSGLEPGKYVLLVRYLNNDVGGVVTVSASGTDMNINTVGTYGGFMYEKSMVDMGQDNQEVVLSNKSGFNGISVIALLREGFYIQEIEKIIETKSKSRVLNVGLHPEENLVSGGQFEAGNTNSFSFIKEKGGFNISESSDVVQGSASLKVSSSSTVPEWSWLASSWIQVSPDIQYEFRTHMKNQDAQNSHIILLGYDESSNKEIQIAQLPNAVSTNTGWDEYRKEIFLDKNITRVRVVLNAGWADGSGREAVTLFDEISLTPLEARNLDNIIPQTERCELQYSHQNPTVWSIEVPESCGSDFFLALNERYNAGWHAYIQTRAKDKEQQSDYLEVPVTKHVVANGFTNAWEIDTEPLGISGANNGYRILLEFTPQRWFYVGLIISGLTLASCLGYLGYSGIRSYRRRTI